ncbi:hypothetical protein ABFS82_11G042800 [Erythranthe guttata]|uniref:uncharacterized protein LOC105960679 n=1 Tax=Erythranthe guttata TaxID=4155 RepID=UPI00064DDD57|nr:PREDICTED: uncharacterized protein LOC105960679 [Erythranthe guttata]|eukprot:XP_012840329.1 PREDICTED: uncharacterized protein LOC105960679 [Erythranthe guttata]
MADFGERIEEIKVIISSKDKALAYAELLQLQEISAVESSALGTLADSSHAILSFVVADIHDNEEEIASQALKCLGFMIYHPTVVASIRGDCADAIIESLEKVITTTKIKSVCNLGVWCISIQQFSSSFLAPHLQSLLRAVTHALDNPIGSLSITFEAMQAVEKLACTLTEHMRSMASLWTPPIYRRLVSLDKRDRDISERCLLKIMPIIRPPPITLAKALAEDMKKKLLVAMKELLDKGMKIPCLQAWGWFIRLLGPYAIKNKHLVNEMLKVLEQTFSDFDSQVQIASLVAWQGLIDVLIEPEVEGSLNNFAKRHDVQVLSTSESNNTQCETDRHTKRIKLIMEPIIGIMSSKCDVSVRASCLSVWSYLLHKLGASVSSQTVIKNVWEPIIEGVFRTGPDKQSIWLWNFCQDLFDILILGRNNTIGGDVAFGKCSVKHYPINCSTWSLCQLDFFIKMISVLVNHESNNSTATSEFRRLASDAALRLFGSLLETVQRALRCVSTTYDDAIRCLNTIFRFLTNMCENSKRYCLHTCLEFLKVATERLEPSVLESPLYKVALENTFIKNLESGNEIRCVTLPGICLVDFEETVLPVVYLSNLYFYVVVNSSLKAHESESVLQHMQGYLKYLLSSYNPGEVLHAFTRLLYKNTVFSSLQIWVVLVNSLKECIEGKQDQSIQKMVKDDIGYSVVLHLLSYPFASWSFCQMNVELQIIVEVWKSLYVSVDQASQSAHLPDKSFSEDFSAILNGCIDQFSSEVDTGTELQLKERKCSGGFVLLSGKIAMCVLKQLALSIKSDGRHNINCDGRKSNILNSMALAARFLKLFWANKEKTDPSHLSVASRFLSELVDFVGCLRQKEDTLILIETISSPLLEWLSEMHILDKNTSYQLQLLWTEMLKALQKNRPPTDFNSSLLKFQQPPLEIALDHPNPAISNATINFWNSTYGAQNKLDFPKTLAPVLHKLSICGKINICSGDRCIEDSAQTFKVTNTLKRCSKRVEITGGAVNVFEKIDSGSKRKRLHELTEHQKEVRRAQQGRNRDCSGHGPGVKTYTALDFSQGNEESQDSPRC